MGAGVVKPRPDGQPGFQIHIHNSNINIGPTATQARTFSTTTTSSSSSRGPSSAAPGQSSRTNSHRNNQGADSEVMSCEECSVAFTVFKRKKPCRDCGRLFCSACTIQIASGRSSPFTTKETQCKKCQIILSGNFNRTQLLKWKIKDLKALLQKQNVNTAKCNEKNDLIDLLFRYFGTTHNLERIGTEHERFVEQMAVRMREEQSSSTPVSPSPTRQSTKDPTPLSTDQIPTATSRSNVDSPQSRAGGLEDRQTQEMTETEARLRQELEEEENREIQPTNPHLRLKDIQSEEEIESLTIKSLKRLLLNNFVDYKGCCERWELQQRVKRLWADNQANSMKDPEKTPSNKEQPDVDLCKICMDATIDCVLLECGHMVTCTQCGKQLSECPICRQYVVRAVHTFRS